MRVYKYDNIFTIIIIGCVSLIIVIFGSLKTSQKKATGFELCAEIKTDSPHKSKKKLQNSHKDIDFEYKTNLRKPPTESLSRTEYDTNATKDPKEEMYSRSQKKNEEMKSTNCSSTKNIIQDRTKRFTLSNVVKLNISGTKESNDSTKNVNRASKDIEESTEISEKRLKLPTIFQGEISKTQTSHSGFEPVPLPSKNQLVSALITSKAFESTKNMLNENLKISSPAKTINLLNQSPPEPPKFIPPPPPPPPIPCFTLPVIQKMKLKKKENIHKKSTPPDLSSSLNRRFKSENNMYSTFENRYKSDKLYIEKLSNKYKLDCLHFNVNDKYKEFHGFSLILLAMKDVFNNMSTDYDFYEVLQNIKKFVEDQNLGNTQRIVDIEDMCKSIIEFADNVIRRETECEPIKSFETGLTQKSHTKEPEKSDRLQKNTNNIAAALLEKFESIKEEQNNPKMSPGKAIQKKMNMSASHIHDSLSILKALLDELVADEVNHINREKMLGLFPNYQMLDSDLLGKDSINSKDQRQIIPYFELDLETQTLSSFEDVMNHCLSMYSPVRFDIPSSSYMIFVINRPHRSEQNIPHTNEKNVAMDSNEIYMPFPLYTEYQGQYFVLQIALASTKKADKNANSVNNYNLFVVQNGDFYSLMMKDMTLQKFGKSLETLQNQGVLFIYRVIDRADVDA